MASLRSTSAPFQGGATLPLAPLQPRSPRGVVERGERLPWAGTVSRYSATISRQVSRLVKRPYI